MSGASQAQHRAKDAGPWTPGPWTAHRAYVNTMDEPNMPVATCDSERMQGRNEADARLIALAPEMAELLDKLDKLVPWEMTPEYLEAGIRLGMLKIEAHSLLARARGEL